MTDPMREAHFTDAQLDQMYEDSKRDVQFVGSEIRQLIGGIRTARAALTALSPSGDEAKKSEGGTIVAPYNPCLAKLRKDEPFFVLLGRDKQAPIAVIAWADAREKAEGKSDWTDEAHKVAATMAAYSGAALPSDPTADTDVESRVRRILCDGWGMSVDSFMQRFTEAGIGFVNTPETRGPSDPTADVTVEELAQFLRDADRETGQCDDDDTSAGYLDLARALLDAFTVGRR